jgi:hypothetical protein
LAEGQAESKLGFLDSVVGLFRGKAGETPATAPASAPRAGRLETLSASFEAALADLDRKAEELRRQSEASAAGGVAQPEERGVDPAAERARKMKAAHAAIRAGIEAAHARLGTGLDKADLEPLRAYLEEVATLVAADKGSQELISRARFAIAKKIQREAGELAVARLVELLERAKEGWPDPVRQGPSARADEIERSRRRRLAETRESFVSQDLAKTAERLLGVVSVWGSDYPEPGTPLWEEMVLQGVAAGIRARLVKDSIELLRRDRDQLLASTEASIGKELDALRRVLQTGVASLEQANQAAASSLRVLDEVVPDVAWEQIRSELPAARGEWASS